MRTDSDIYVDIDDTILEKTTILQIEVHKSR